MSSGASMRLVRQLSCLSKSSAFRGVLHRSSSTSIELTPHKRPVWTLTRSWNQSRKSDSLSLSGVRSRTNSTQERQSTESLDFPTLNIEVDNTSHNVATLLLRDACTCAHCVDPSTKQKLFSTVDIPRNLSAKIEPAEDGVKVLWVNDVSGYADHRSYFDNASLRYLVHSGVATKPRRRPRAEHWTAEAFSRQAADMDYESYMHDEAALHQALSTLYTHGLLFLTNVPQSESSVSRIAERIGPLKNTFYGMTWDVRSVPQAKNVAYTAQDLGFHMDLLYMKQPPRLQFLHCMRSSTSGGMSLFTDSFKAASDLKDRDQSAFEVLRSVPVTFHYVQPGSQYYFSGRCVIEENRNDQSRSRNLPTADRQGRQFHAISWAPPFQGFFDFRRNRIIDVIEGYLQQANRLVHEWHDAASKFNDLIHRPENIYERMMQPGDCVIFDNRRTLHARKAFDVGDAGRERWLRGAYLDADPFLSKLQILQDKFGVWRGTEAAGTAPLEEEDDEVL